MDENPRGRRKGVGGVVRKTPESMKQMSEASKTITTFRDSTDLQEKARAAQALKGMMGNEELDPEVRQMVKEFGGSMKLDGFLSMVKTTQDLRRVSNVARRDTGVPGVETDETFESLLEDEGLDPIARDMAGRFGHYLPIAKRFEETGAVKKALPGGEVIEKDGGKNKIKNSEGKVIMSPGASDDPRQVAIIAGAMEDLLSGKAMQDVKPGQVAKPLDDINGRPFVGTYVSGSKMTQDLSSQLIGKTSHLDEGRRARMGTWLQNGNRDMNPEGRVPTPTVPKPPPRPPRPAPEPPSEKPKGPSLDDM